MTYLESSARTAPKPRPDDLDQRLEQHRGELTGYCYRMLGSAFEAEDAVQETMIRAWKSYDNFEGRASLRSWLYRIATNVCLDFLSGRERRARPMDLAEPKTADTALPGPMPEATWILPMPDARVLPTTGDPAELAVAKDSVRLAFIAALQHLPPRQRAVLILREVLRWQASEVAQLLDTSVPSVNSALQRARATLAATQPTVDDTLGPLDEEKQALLGRYVAAFEQYDMDALIPLLRDDAMWSMPPYAMWLRGHTDIRSWCLGPGIGCRGSRLVPTAANGAPAFGQYRPSGPGRWEPWSLQVIEGLSTGHITGVTFFLDTASLFPLFGLPDHLEA